MIVIPSSKYLGMAFSKTEHPKEPLLQTKIAFEYLRTLFNAFIVLVLPLLYEILLQYQQLNQNDEALLANLT